MIFGKKDVDLDFVQSAECSLSADMKDWVQGWLTVGVKASVGGLTGGSADLSIVLTPASCSSLEAFIGGSVFAGLDLDVQVGLHTSAVGGVAGSLDAGIHASLSSWAALSSCPLDAGLKASLGLWLNSTLGAGVQAAGSASAYGYSSVAGQIAA